MQFQIERGFGTVMNDKMTNCKTCGAEIAKNANACPNCGAKVKKPIFKKWWFWVIIVIIIFGIIGSAGGDSTDPKEETNPPVMNTIEPTVIPSDFPSDEDSVKLDPDTIKTLIESTISDSFDYYKVEGDETGFTIDLAGDGVTSFVMLAKANGEDETNEEWVGLKESMMGMYNSLYEMIETFGMEDPTLMISVLNDTNTENYLLVILNGSFIYDVMAE